MCSMCYAFGLNAGLSEFRIHVKGMMSLSKVVLNYDLYMAGHITVIQRRWSG